MLDVTFGSHVRTKAINVEVLVNDDIQQRVARWSLHCDFLAVPVDEVHRHLVVRPVGGGQKTVLRYFSIYTSQDNERHNDSEEPELHFTAPQWSEVTTEVFVKVAFL